MLPVYGTARRAALRCTSRRAMSSGTVASHSARLTLPLEEVDPAVRYTVTGCAAQPFSLGVCLTQHAVSHTLASLQIFDNIEKEKNRLMRSISLIPSEVCGVNRQPPQRARSRP